MMLHNVDVFVLIELCAFPAFLFPELVHVSKVADWYVGAQQLCPKLVVQAFGKVAATSLF